MPAELPDRCPEPKRLVRIEPGPDVRLGGEQGLLRGGDQTGFIGSTNLPSVQSLEQEVDAALQQGETLGDIAIRGGHGAGRHQGHCLAEQESLGLRLVDPQEIAVTVHLPETGVGLDEAHGREGERPDQPENRKQGDEGRAVGYVKGHGRPTFKQSGNRVLVAAEMPSDGRQPHSSKWSHSTPLFTEVL